MIYITLGSQKFQFNRLLIVVDRLVAEGKITDEVFAQTGYSDYLPKHYQYKPVLDRDEYAQMMEKADIVITHGGTGAIIGAVKKGKKVIAVPRLAKYREHVDNHQLQCIGEFKEMNLICACYDCDDLKAALRYVRAPSTPNTSSLSRTVLPSAPARPFTPVPWALRIPQPGSASILRLRCRKICRRLSPSGKTTWLLNN